MLLSLWFDFWPANYGPWPTGSGPLPDGGAKGGKGSGRFNGIPQVPAIPDGAYFRASEEYWEEREKFLLRHQPIVSIPSAYETPKVQKIVERHNRALEIVARVHVSGARLINLEKMLRDLESQFAATMKEQADEDELIEILLLGV